MNRSTFVALLQKYQQQTASDAEKQVVEQWYILLEEQPRQLTEKEWLELENRLWQKLQNQISGIEVPAQTIFIPFWQLPVFKLGVAASVVVATALGYLSYQDNGTDTPSQALVHQKVKGMELVVNTTSTMLPVTLEDGSKVTLSPQSELRFPTHFMPQQREVFLTGEAFFEITENPTRPFLVNAGQLVTKVLGTSFSVRAKQDSPEVEVSVKTGKVSVYERDKTGQLQSNKNGNGVILTPNHRVVFSTENKLFITGLVEKPAVLVSAVAAQKIAFVFDDSPISYVLNQLKKAYSIDIEIDNKALSDCPLTANLTDKSLYAQLDIICAAIEGSYEVKGTTILISGKGCE